MNQAPKINHWPSCRSDYPEKVEGERPRQINCMDIGDGERVFTCVDCGSSVVVDAASEELNRDL